MLDLTIALAGKKITTLGNIADRSHMKYKALVGRTALKGFMIDPSKEHMIK